jgi:hypothetical protein
MDNNNKDDAFRDEFGVVAGIRRLRRLTTNIRSLGLMTVISTGGSIASFTYLLATFRRSSLIFPDPFYLLFIFAFASVAALIVRDTMRKTGESLFEELSDEVQWFVLHEKYQLAKGVEAVRPPLEIRYELRRFARNTDLPLISEPAGTAVYALLNLALLLIGAYFSYAYM